MSAQLCRPPLRVCAGMLWRLPGRACIALMGARSQSSRCLCCLRMPRRQVQCAPLPARAHLCGAEPAFLAAQTAVMAGLGPLFGLTRMQAVRSGLLLAAGGEFAFVALCAPTSPTALLFVCVARPLMWHIALSTELLVRAFIYLASKEAAVDG